MFSVGTRTTRAKPGRPSLNLGHPLVDDSLVFACAYGWRRGYTDRGAGDFGDREERSRMKGVWTLGAGDFQYVDGPHGGMPAGWGCDNGDGVTGDSSQQWGPPAARWQDLSAQANTWAVSIRPDVLQTNGQIPFFKRSAQPYGAANAGWRFTAAAGNFWRFNWSNGVTQGTLTSTTAQDPNFLRIDFLVARFVPNGANVDATLWVNGVLEASSINNATTLVNAAATEDTKILGLGPLNERFAGATDVAYVWGRPLSTPEIMRLSADRFEPWRHHSRRRQGMAW